MVRMQASHLRDPGAVQALQETQARITAIGGVHRRLYMHSQIGLVAMNDYLNSSPTNCRATLQDQERPHRIALSAENFTVSTDKAVPIGVIVGELTTNAFKYAYPPGTAGEIRISLRRAEPMRAELLVEDDGIGFDDSAPPAGIGLGSKILRSMAANLHGEIVRNAAAKGTSISIRFPLDERDLDAKR